MRTLGHEPSRLFKLPLDHCGRELRYPWSVLRSLALLLRLLRLDITGLRLDPGGYCLDFLLQRHRKSSPLLLVVSTDKPNGRFNSLFEHVQPRRGAFQIMIVDLVQLVQQADSIQQS